MCNLQFRGVHAITRQQTANRSERLGMTGKIGNALIRREADTYRSHGLSKEARDLYQNLLAASPHIPADIKAAIESQLQQIELEIGCATPEECQALSDEQIAIIKQGWGKHATVEDILTCATSFYQMGRYGDALEELKRAMRRNVRPARWRPAWFNCTGLRPCRLPSTNWEASFFGRQGKFSRFNSHSPRKYLSAAAAITAGCFFVMWGATGAFRPRSAAASLPLRMNWMPLIPPAPRGLRPARALLPTAPPRPPDPVSTGSGRPSKSWVAGCSRSAKPRDDSLGLKFSM